MTRSIALACFLTALGSPVLADEAALLSPRLQRLRNDTATQGSAVADFWQERRAAGTPMIETTAGDAGHVLATFLWQGDASTKNVYVVTIDQNQFDSAAYLARARMDLLPGTDIWYRTYRMPCDLLFSYRFQ